MKQPRANSPGSRAWAVVAWLWPVVLLNYCDRQMMATVRASIRADIPSIANDQDFGTLMAVFMWVYAFLSPVGGFIADKFSRRLTIIGSLLVWSAVTWATGHATSYRQFLFFRSLMGISEAFYMPGALALITDFHAGPTRARAVGIHQSGIYAGLALGGIAGYIAQTSSWRNCFTWFGAVGVLYAIVLTIALREPPKSPGETGSSEKRVTLSKSLGALGTNTSFWILVVYFTLPAIAGWAAKNWLPTYLADTFHLKEGPAGLSASGYIQIASFVGVLLGGAVADAWLRATSRGRLFTSALGVLLMAPSLLGLGYILNLNAAIAFMIFFGLGWGFYDCNNMPILCQIASARHRATGYGIMNFVSISVGAGATIALGWMRDSGIKFSLAFAICAALAVLSAGLALLIKPRREDLK
jgi:MFS transporter, Spinster family, sphingosine-1-phosphate transporter